MYSCDSLFLTVSLLTSNDGHWDKTCSVEMKNGNVICWSVHAQLLFFKYVGKLAGFRCCFVEQQASAFDIKNLSWSHVMITTSVLKVGSLLIFLCSLFFMLLAISFCLLVLLSSLIKIVRVFYYFCVIWAETTSEMCCVFSGWRQNNQIVKYFVKGQSVFHG